MIRPWEKFSVVQGQVEVERVSVIRRSRNVLVFEVEAQQKYCEPLGWTGSELLLCASERTREDSYDKDAMATCIVFPRAVRGWDVIVPSRMRYSMRVALYRPWSGRWLQRRWPWLGQNAMTERDDEWWLAMRTEGKE
jgi:hypothetical protein